MTDKIVEMLEAGVVPWRKPWKSAGLPRNLVSKKAYRGINLFLLSGSTFLSPYWLTYRQANEFGGSVRKGEQSTVVIFWKVDRVPKEEEAEQGDTENKHIFLLRYYRVFNSEQCDFPQSILDKLPEAETHHHDPIASAEAIIAAMPNHPEIITGGSKAFYSSLTDRITMPSRELFVSAEEFYATLNHELVHYADFRIMPRITVRASMGSKIEQKMSA